MTEEQTTSVETEGAPRRLPFSKWWPLLGGALVGVALRLMFGVSHRQMLSVMGWPFIYLTPVAVSAITVYLAERRSPRTWGYYFRSGAVANLLFVLGTLLIMIEGLICAVIVAPLFMVIGGFAGMLIGFLCRKMVSQRATIYSLAALPVVVGALVGTPPPDLQSTHRITRSVVIAAPATAVWQQIHDARDIRPEEVGSAWMYRIGVPLPQSGVTQDTEHGRVRKITMGKAIHFEQVVQAWEENRHVRWTYRFAPDSFPAGALDDHVRIGGAYFDLIDTAYTLTPMDGEKTRLDIDMGYRVSTDFNWYAAPVAVLLMGNFEEVILKFYARRSELSIAG